MKFKPVTEKIETDLLYAFRYSEIRNCSNCPFYSYRQCGMNEYEHRCSLGIEICTNSGIPNNCKLLTEDK